MTALIIVDVQNDFIDGGALAVPSGSEVIPIINALQTGFDLVVATQDWHPPDHASFATNHPGRQPYDQIDLHGLPQTLWPSHCVQGTTGADFAPGLDRARWERVFQKGTDPEIDSYSGFFDNGHRRPSGLGDYLRARGVKEVAVVGVATDYCVKFTALDALGSGLRVRLIVDACRGVELRHDDTSRALDEMRAAGVELQIKRRPSARWLLLNGAGRVLLFRFVFNEGALAGQDFWATPGGGVEPGETFEQAAVRELREETGIRVENIAAPVASREFVLRLFDGSYVLADERYFFARIAEDTLSRDGWTPEERKDMIEHRWWSQTELARAAGETVWPENLLAMIEAAAH